MNENIIKKKRLNKDKISLNKSKKLKSNEDKVEDDKELDVEQETEPDLNEFLGEEIQFEPEDIKQDDPFRQQYDYELCPDVLNALSSKPASLSEKSLRYQSLGNLRFFHPNISSSNSDNTVSIIDKTIYASQRNVLNNADEFSLEKVFIKGQLIKNYCDTSERFIKKDLTLLQKELFNIISNYQDLYFTERNFTNGEELRLVYCTHAVNHALKTRLKIIHNNSKLSKGKDVEYRDHGLVRPKVLILVPFRDSALRIIKMIMSVLIGQGGNVENKKRFLNSYSGETLRMPQKNPKPLDYQQTFFGNTDDNFKIGLALAKKSLKLYVDFYGSDIIVASPLGLRMLIGTEGESERDYDFLSSIEVLIIDQAEVLFMQNWEHVLHVMSHMHLVPKESHGTDLTRVHMWALNGWSKYYRQNLVFTSHPLPEITAFFNVNSKNFAGKFIVNNPITSGTISQIIVPIPQIFHEISASSVMSAVDKRFEEFISKFLPEFSDPMMKHTMIYVPSYFDYVKIRNHFKKHDVSFVQICEYTKEGKIARARDLFYHGEVHFMLYSERFHFFRRIRVKGIRHVLFYQPPAFPHFYSEISNFIKELKSENVAQSDLSITVLYTKYDVMQLSSIVGTDRATRMLASDKNVHMFMTDDA